MEKEVARSLTSLLKNPIMERILDKISDIKTLVEDVNTLWKFDLYKRKPGPAYTEDNIFIGTDLDLTTFLLALVDRKAVINIPKYENFRPSSHTEGVNVIANNRHGQLLGLVSNKEIFSFSARIHDMNVTTTDKVGDYRNFALTNPFGDLYEGWHTIEFLPSAKENDFLSDHNLWSDNKVVFKNFVSPNRWVSLYGKSYFITKALIDRVSDECRFYKGCIDKMLSDGVKPTQVSGGGEYPETFTAKGEKVTVPSLEVEIDVPEYTGFYNTPTSTTENLDRLIELRKDLIYKQLPKLRFVTRVTELAFYKYGNYNFPAWIQNAKWEENYVPKGKRTKWNRLVLFQPGVGERGVAIRCREVQRLEEVSKEYATFLESKK